MILQRLRIELASKVNADAAIYSLQEEFPIGQWWCHRCIYRWLGAVPAFAVYWAEVYMCKYTTRRRFDVRLHRGIYMYMTVHVQTCIVCRYIIIPTISFTLALPYNCSTTRTWNNSRKMGSIALLRLAIELYADHNIYIIIIIQSYKSIFHNCVWNNVQ